MAQLVSERKYAEMRKQRGLPGGTRTAVRKALESGRIKKTEDGRINPAEADAAWAANTDPTMGKRRPAIQEHAIREIVVQENLDLTYERARLAKAQADKVEIDNAERAGRLVDMDAAIRVFSGQVMTAKNRLLGMGAKLASELCGAAGVTVSKAPALQQVVENEVREILEELSVDAACDELRDGRGTGD